MRNQRVAVPVGELKVGMFVSELDRPWESTPFLLQGFTIRNDNDIDEIKQHCQLVYVENMTEVWEAVQKKKSFALKNSKRTVNSAPTRQQQAVAKSTYNETRSLTKSFMDEVALGQAIKVDDVKRTVSSCVESVAKNPDTMMWMMRMRSEDAYTSEHCMNVGLLAIVFGKHLGLADQDLEYLGFAGIVHDVGKMQISNDILNKPGPLNKEEYAEMQKHTIRGREILMAHKNMTPHAIDIAYGHHELLDGTGYPRALKASGISAFTRIITLCDVYDAITSDRVYKKGRASNDALNVLYRERGRKFDKKLTESFIRCIGLYPLGSVVELCAGQIAVVISINREHRRLPKIIVLRGVDKNPCVQRVIDLKREAGKGKEALMIRCILPNGSYGVRVEKLIEEGLVIA